MNNSTATALPVEPTEMPDPEPPIKQATSVRKQSIRKKSSVKSIPRKPRPASDEVVFSRLYPKPRKQDLHLVLIIVVKHNAYQK